MKKIVFAVEDTDVVREATEWLAASGICSGTDTAVVCCSSDSTEKSPITFDCKSSLAAQNNDANFHALTLEGNTNNLIEFASNNSCEMIVLAKTERSNLDKLLHGSVSQHVLEHAACPVLLAKNSNSECANNVIIAVDDSANSAAALDWVSQQNWLKKKKVLLLSVIKPASGAINHFTSTAQAAETMLKRQVEESVLSLLLEAWAELMAERLQRESVPFMVPDGDAKEKILEIANLWPSELIVMGSHGRTGLNKLVLGSVSQSVSVSAQCSCLVIRSDHENEFNKLRIEIENSSELFRARKERPHPARVSSSCVGTDLNGFFINF